MRNGSAESPVLPPVLDSNRPFVAALQARFPEVAAEIDFQGASGLLQIEVGSFEQVSLRAYNAGDLNAVRRYFAFADAALDGADDALTNALHVSYAEGFAWGSEHEQRARRLMPERLGAAYDAMREHLHALSHRAA